MAKARSTAPSPLILSAHGSPAQSPDQSSSFEIASGRATRRTSLFRGNLELQTSPERHSMPGGVETTRPRPSPRTRTVNVSITTVKAAETAFDSARSSSHDIPLQFPPKPEKAKPSAAAASRRTRVPAANAAEHVPSQSRPVGVERILPCPLTVTASRTLRSRKVAETAASDDRTRSQAPVPAHAPDQASNSPFPSAAASRCTGAPAGNSRRQEPLQ